MIGLLHLFAINVHMRSRIIEACFDTLNYMDSLQSRGRLYLYSYLQFVENKSFQTEPDFASEVYLTTLVKWSFNHQRIALLVNIRFLGSILSGTRSQFSFLLKDFTCL